MTCFCFSHSLRHKYFTSFIVRRRGTVDMVYDDEYDPLPYRGKKAHKLLLTKRKVFTNILLEMATFDYLLRGKF